MSEAAPVLVLLALIVTLLALPTFELPRPFPLIVAILAVIIAWVLVIGGGRLDL